MSEHERPRLQVADAVLEFATEIDGAINLLHMQMKDMLERMGALSKPK